MREKLIGVIKKAAGNNQKWIDDILTQWGTSKKCCISNMDKLR